MPPPRKLYPQDIPLPPLEYEPLDDASPDTEPAPGPLKRPPKYRLEWQSYTQFRVIEERPELEYEDCEGE